MITRKEYMQNSDILHHSYYSQFSPIINEVCQKVTRKGAMLFGHDNYLPLDYWGNLHLRIYRDKMQDAGDFLTPAGAVCIKKAVVLAYLIRSGHYKYAVTCIRNVGDFKRYQTEFFIDHQSAFEFYSTLSEKIKGVYVIDKKTGKVDGVNVTGNFFTGEAIGLDVQLRTIIDTVIK